MTVGVLTLESREFHLPKVKPRDLSPDSGVTRISSVKGEAGYALQSGTPDAGSHLLGIASGSHHLSSSAEHKNPESRSLGHNSTDLRPLSPPQLADAINRDAVSFVTHPYGHYAEDSARIFKTH